ncbi:glycosyl hydrolase family 18 protein [Metabacillus halosaccharovorans]|uniref:glycosyl hydrolase family 18 protein n=1 Tax=Metabacillus halosaccharovorans TaxID=930124 RepID=UPI0034CD6882
MRKNNIKILMILIIFTGGIFSGILYQNNSEKKTNVSNVLTKAPKSEKNPTLKETPQYQEEKKKVLIGYVQDFRDPSSIDYAELTHVIFSFVHPAKDGRVLMNGETAKTNLKEMVKKAHEQKTKVLLAVGGWYHIEGGESYDYFRAAISNRASRTKLVDELISLTKSENLDGIDIDFEHPRSNEDAENLNIFIQALDEKLSKLDKELSIAVYSKIHSVTGTEIQSVVFKPEMFNYVDYVNIMAYDGQWDGEYNAANLSPYPFAEDIVDYWSTLFDKHKLSKEKLILGVPFYAQPEDVSINQMSYGAIVKANPENAQRDTVKMHGTTYHYNGIQTINKKTDLALDNGFGGMMIWELGHDAKGNYSLTNTISKELAKENEQQSIFAKVYE